MKYLFIILLTCLIPAMTLSQNKVEMEHEGVPGFWFDEATGTKMLLDLTEFHVLKLEKIPALNLKIKKLEFGIQTLELELIVTEKIAAKWETQFGKVDELRVKEVERLQEKLNSKDRWYKSPPVYLISGVILGGLLAVGLNYGLQEVR